MRVHLVLAALGIASLAFVGGCAESIEGHDPGAGGGAQTGDGGGGAGDQGDGGSCPSSGLDCELGVTRSCTGRDPTGAEFSGVDRCVELDACRTTWSYGCWTPLVLSFDGARVDYLSGGPHTFDLNGSQSAVTDWPTARTPWLAIDRDGDGKITSGAELFGSMSPLAEGGVASNGFAALRALDDDGDGRITPADASFAKLLVWADRDGDRTSSAGELAPASAWGIVSIELGYRVAPRCDARGNCEIERATFRFRDASGAERTGEVVDVHVAPQAL